MAVMTAVNLLSARSYGEFEFWFSSIKVAAIIAFILVTAAYAFGFTSPAGATFSNLTAHGGFAPKGWVPVLATVTTVFFSLVGAEITTVAAAESKDPEKAVVRMATTITWRILLFYVLSLFLIVSVVAWPSVRPGESPFTLALSDDGFRLGQRGDELHHPHRRALLPEFRGLRLLARPARDGRTWRRAALAR